jgi:hypothetical protein
MTDASVATQRAYRSIFLDDGWAHQKYFGWGLDEDLPGLRVLRKRRPGLSRSLMLLGKGGEAVLAGAVARSFGRLGIADVVVHDFDEVLPDEPFIGERRFHRASQAERLLNIATYAIDLELPEEALWQNLGPKSRNVIRKAEDNHTKFVVDLSFNQFMAYFYKFYQKIAAKNALDVPKFRTLERMYENKDIILVCAFDGHDKPVLSNIVYVTQCKAFYMYGAGDAEVGAGVGQFAQWKSIFHLKRLGYSWYDLGGVKFQSSTDGVHKFKKSLGGSFHKVGSEFRYATFGFEFVRSSVARLRNTLQK